MNKVTLIASKGIREDYPPEARDIIKKHGNERIVSAKTCRKPLTQQPALDTQQLRAKGPTHDPLE